MRYWAFISYSHTDKKWGDWLHKSLETYRVPARLVGRDSRDGKIPARLFPIFRDREELPVSADLSSNINEALRESRYLIVICSPRSARSRWVGEEIETFKRLGREDRILALIVDGEPNASDGKPGFAREEECFPEAMRYRKGGDGESRPIRAEPIAADVREGKDGRNNARLKLLAALLGVNYDELRQRDQERRLRRARRIGLAAASLVILFAGLTVWATLAAREAARQKREAQRLLAASDCVHAQELFDRGESAAAVAFLARAAEQDPDAESVAAERLWFALTERAWPMPLSGPMSHRERVTSVCFSPDEKKVLTSSLDGTVRLWDAHSGQPLGLPLVHPRSVRRALFLPNTPYVLTVCMDGLARAGDPISGKFLPGGVFANPDTTNAIAISPSGKYFATGSQDGTIRIWGSSDFRQVGEIHEPENVHTLSFHPMDDRLLLGVSGRAALLWEVPEGLLRFEFKHGDEINAATFDPKGDRILTASNDRSCRLWEVQSGKPLGSELRHDEQVVNAFFSANGDSIASIAGSEVYLWRSQAPAILERKLEHESAVTSAAFSNDGLSIFTATPNGKGREWNVATGKLLGEPIEEDSAVVAMAVARSGDKLLLGTAAGTARIWKPAPRFPIADRLTHGDSVESITLSPDGRGLLSACDDGNARRWNLDNTGSPPNMMKHGAAVLAAAFHPAGNLILTGAADATARLWQAASGAPLGEPISHDATVTKVAFRPDGKVFATATETGTARLWDTQTRRPVGEPIRHEPHITTLQFSPDGKILMTAGWDGKVRFWNSSNGEAAQAPIGKEKEITCATFSPDGEMIGTGHRDGEVDVWSKDGRRLHRMAHARTVNDLAFDRAGPYLITGSDDETASIWNWRTGNPLGAPLRHRAPVTAVAFDPARERVATASDDGVVQLWDCLTGRPITETLSHEKGVTCLLFSRDGRTLFSGSRDRTIRVWDVAAQTNDRMGLVRFARAISPLELQPSGRLARREMTWSTEVLSKGNYGEAASLAQWFFAPPRHRRLTPFAKIDLETFLKNRLRENLNASAEARFYLGENLRP